MENEPKEIKFTPVQARKYAGFTSEQMAKKLNIGRASYSFKERGKRVFTLPEAEKFLEITRLNWGQVVFSCKDRHKKSATRKEKK